MDCIDFAHFFTLSYMVKTTPHFKHDDVETSPYRVRGKGFGVLHNLILCFHSPTLKGAETRAFLYHNAETSPFRVGGKVSVFLRARKLELSNTTM